MSFLAGALPSLVAGAFSAFGPNAGAQRQQLKNQNAVMKNQLGIMQQLRAYANGPVGSDPIEAANFANQRAQLGQQQHGQQQQLLAQYNRNTQTPGGTGDFLNNMNSNFTAQNMALNAQNSLAAMQNRRSALLQSAQVGQSVPNYQPPTNGLPELFGALAQTWGHQQELNKQQQAEKQQQLLWAQAQNAGMPSQNVPTPPGMGPGAPMPGGYNPGPAFPGGLNPALGGQATNLPGITPGLYGHYQAF